MTVFYGRCVAPLAAFAALIAAPATLTAEEAVALPTGDMVLTRVLERSLTDGKSIIVERQWIVRFDRTETGIAILGRQLSARVDAPPSLRQFAELEERRSTSAMFPVLLDAQGRIVSAGRPADGNLRQAAYATATDALASTFKDTAGLADARAGLAHLQKSSENWLTQLPQDLFYPAAQGSHMAKDLALDGGLKGSFTLDYDAKASADGAWLSRAERQVTTEIGGQRKVSRESWTLSRN